MASCSLHKDRVLAMAFTACCYVCDKDKVGQAGSTAGDAHEHAAGRCTHTASPGMALVHGETATHSMPRNTTRPPHCCYM